MNISIPKLKAILLYFSNFTERKFLGKVKLMKLFYFLDFMHVKKYGSPVTYDNYVNLEHGPIPSSIKNLVDTADDDIDNSILADTISFEKMDGEGIHRIIPKRKFTEQDKEYFSTTEFDILTEVCKKFGDKNTKYIEEASHNESPWKETKFLGLIPYALAANDPDCIARKEEIEMIVNL
ncbi:MAG: Panacea domain-containing protein [Patescibacteria group bacterium]